MDYDVVIIGAGASGLTAAIAASRQGSSVLVIEQKEKAGKKILATGNGKCNFTNLYQESECYRSDDSAFAGKVLSHFDVSRTLQFFKELGIYPKEREGYLYPNSEQAASVLSVLMMECDRLGVHFRYQEKVKEIKKPFYTVITEESISEENTKASKDNKKGNNRNIKANEKNTNAKNINSINTNEKNTNAKNTNAKNIDTNKTCNLNAKTSNDKTLNDNRYEYKNDKFIFTVKMNQYHAKKVILAAGGCASPKLGSDGSGFQLAKSLGHTLIKPLPALVQLKSPDQYCKTVSGVRTHATVSVYSDGKQMARESGEILFTDYGLSGIPVLQISRYAAKAIDLGKKVYLNLDYLPDITEEELKQLIIQRIKQNPNKNLEEMLIGLLNHKLAYIIILESKLDPHKDTKSLSVQNLDKLIHNMKEFRMNINDTNSFENAQVCSGGVSTKEIDDLTMESKLSKGLYLTGEILDVDGTCGGYNLQWAWSSGYLAGTAAGQRK